MKNTLALMVSSLVLAACAATSDYSSPSVTADLRPASGSKVNGKVTFTQAGERVRITGQVAGHSPGPKGFHIHEKGDCSAPDAMSTGGHFNPHKTRHGAPGQGHGGDLGNLVFDEYGRASVDITVTGISISSDRPDGIIGRGLIVHAQPDDLKTDPTGNAGGRVACAVIR